LIEIVPLGYHEYNWLENNQGTGNSTFNSASGGMQGSLVM